MALSLEPGRDGVIAQRFLHAAHRSEFWVTLHHVADAHRHQQTLPQDRGILLFIATILLRVFILAETEMCLRPVQGQLKFLLVVNLMIDAATQFGHIHRLHLHPQPGFKEVVIDNRARNPHRDAAHRQITFPLHAGDRQARPGEAQQFFLNVCRDGLVARILYIVAIYGKRRDPFLVMRRQCRREIYCPRTLGAVKAPDRFRTQRIHINGFTPVTPAGGDGDRQTNVARAELLFASGGLRHSGNAAIGNHALNGRTAGVA